jgi:hypothetical protein
MMSPASSHKLRLSVRLLLLLLLLLLCCHLQEVRTACHPPRQVV